MLTLNHIVWKMLPGCRPGNWGRVKQCHGAAHFGLEVQFPAILVDLVQSGRTSAADKVLREVCPSQETQVEKPNGGSKGIPTPR